MAAFDVEAILDEDNAAGIAGVVHRGVSPYYDTLDDNIHFPINHGQVRDVLGKVLTHLDAMGLSDRQRRAAKTLLTQEVWRWWGEACSNSVTSYQGCLSPIVLPGPYVSDGPSNRWGWDSEEAFLKANGDKLKAHWAEPADEDQGVGDSAVAASVGKLPG